MNKPDSRIRLLHNLGLRKQPSASQPISGTTTLNAYESNVR